MSKTFLLASRLLFLALLLLGQSSVGFGHPYDDYDQNEDQDINSDENRVNIMCGQRSTNNSNSNDNNNANDNEDNQESQHQVFTAVSSLFFTPGTAYTVFFSANPHWKNEPLQLKCILMANSDNSTTIESHNITLCPGQSGQISIPLPREMPGGETVWRLFAWSFTETDDSVGYKHFAPHTLIQSSSANSNRPNVLLTKVSLASVFIQTDKPVYKPGDLIRIRVITMGTDDLPHLTSGVNMTITDSQGNLMKRWQQPLELPESVSVPANVSSVENVGLFGEFQKKRNGLSAYEYQLSGEPILGNWKIQAQAGNITERMHFDVQKYILPKFQVKIHTSSVLYGRGTVKASATIKVSYTYGKELHGTGNVTVYSGYDGQKTIQQIVVKDGEVKVPLTFSSAPSYQSVHTITANVTEENTGRWEIGKATVRIYPQETYTIQWINQPASYNPGLPITVQLKITGQDGFPVKDGRVNSLRLIFPSSLNLPAREISIALNGIATFSFRTPLDPLPANTQFTAQYQKSTRSFQLPKAQRATASGIFIEVVPPSGSFNFIQGQSYNFTIRSNKPIQPELFHCLLWDEAGMEVHGAQTVVNNQSEPATEFPFPLRIPRGDYINLKIFVYFETEVNARKHMISTFKSINTHNYLKIRVSRPPPPSAASGINNSSEVAIGGVEANAPLASSSEATVETTTKTTTTVATLTDPQYVYDDEIEAPADDPGVVEQPEPQLQSKTGDNVEVVPGAAVEIHFETYPDSTIAIRGIDQSLLLLTEQDNDLSQDRINNQRVNPLSGKSHLENISTDTSTFLRTFGQLGISILSSEKVVPFEPIGPTSHGDDLNGMEEGEMAGSENVVLDASSIPQVDSRLRTNFPETWLWEEFESSNDSSTTVLHKILPDTLTSWIISGFSLNPKMGLGVASPTTITGFMPFFVTLNFPYSVFKYETFDLQVIVHNYLDRDVNVFVTLFNKHKEFDFDFDFETKGSGSNQAETGNQTRSVKVERNHAALVHFLITPLVFGEIPIEVKAVTEDGAAGDSMLRHLKVKPDGVMETRSETIVFEEQPADASMNRTMILDVNFPTGMVNGANTLRLTAVGDSMGTLLSDLGSTVRSGSGLGHLLRLPYGCGWQNMSPFVANIQALLYLSATLRSTDAQNAMQQAKRNLQAGYQHQLQYRKSDGSFCVYRSESGDSSLTSYVFRWFVVAQQYITIDDYVIRGAVNYVRRMQSSDGSFSSDAYTTAYNILNFIKVNERLSDPGLRVAIANGMQFISRQAVYDINSDYVTTIVTACLMAGKHGEKDHFFEKMEKGAKTATNAQGVKVKFWGTINERDRASGPTSIKMTSYALLAHLWRKSTLDASTVKIHNWLLSQRNPQGGFFSTDDTAIAITALTEFALRPELRFEAQSELQLNIRASSSPTVTELAVHFLHRNRMVLQEFDLPVSTQRVAVQATGRGAAVIQMTETWYMPIKNRETRSPPDHFNITAKMTIPNRRQQSETELKLCVNSYHTSGAKDSIASIELPTGYVFSPLDYEVGSVLMAGKPRNVPRFELTQGNTKMDVYYSEVKGYPPTCLTLPATQHYEVVDAKNPPIHVYEYADPKRSARIVYEPAHNITRCQICRHTGVPCGNEKCD